MGPEWIYKSPDDSLQTLFFDYTGWHLPDLIVMPLMLGAMLAFLSVSALFLIWLERKVSAAIQLRMGPMLTGPRFLANNFYLGGALQTAADAIKLLLKELIIPSKADAFPFVLAPILIFAICLSAFVVIPFAPALSITDLNIGLLYVISVSSLTVLSILMAGWASNNKYSLLGGLRSAAQMLSYEIPLLFALLGPILMAGTLSMQGIVAAQKDYGAWFLVPSFIGLVVYFICGIAEVNRPPFDIPEAESELVAGYVSEYSGMMFAMFFLAEFCNMMLICAICTTVFAGGWAIPFIPIPPEPSLAYMAIGCIIFFIKTYFFIAIMMWVRWTFPRVRPDHLMNFGWKFMLPMAFVNMVICAGVAILKVMGLLQSWMLYVIGVVALGATGLFFASYRAHDQATPSPSVTAATPPEPKASPKPDKEAS